MELVKNLKKEFLPIIAALSAAAAAYGLPAGVKKWRGYLREDPSSPTGWVSEPPWEVWQEELFVYFFVGFFLTIAGVKLTGRRLYGILLSLLGVGTWKWGGQLLFYKKKIGEGTHEQPSYPVDYENPGFDGVAKIYDSTLAKALGDYNPFLDERVLDTFGRALPGGLTYAFIIYNIFKNERDMLKDSGYEFSK